MIRMIVQVEAPDTDANKPGTYATFDVTCAEMETYLSKNGLKGILGYEIRAQAAVVPLKVADKPDPDAAPKDATALELFKHKKALEAKKDGKLPPKLRPDEPIMDQYKRMMDNLKAEAEKIEAKRKKEEDEKAEKKRQESNAKLKAEQEAWDKSSIWNRMRTERPSKKPKRETATA